MSENTRTCLVFAHRGLATTSAENTLEAFRAAVAAGAQWIETDVNTTADGQIVVFHDPTLNRMAGRSGVIGQMTWSELKDCELIGGGKIPLLSEALAAFPEIPFNIDLKDTASAENIAQVLREAGAEHRVRLASFSEARLRVAHRRLREAGLPVQLSASKKIFTLFFLLSRLSPRIWPALQKVGGRVLTPFDSLQIPDHHVLAGRRVNLIDRRLLEAARRAGVQVHVWTIDDEPTMRRLLALGVDGIVTNRTDLLTAVLASSR